MNNQTADRCEGSTPGQAGSNVAGCTVALVEGSALPMALGRALPLVQGSVVRQSGSPHEVNGRSIIDDFYSPGHAVATMHRGRS